MKGTVQIDEAYFGGKAKYGKRRRLQYDRQTQEPDPKEYIVELLSEMSTNEREEENDAPKVNGPWVLGIYQDACTVRFIIVPDRRGSTLIPIIEKYGQRGSRVVSDEWAGYRRLSDFGYIHETVCHKRNYVNPEAGWHTQAIERSGADARIVIKRNRGALKGKNNGDRLSLLRAHLDEVCLRKSRKNKDDYLSAFLDDLRLVFDEE